MRTVSATLATAQAAATRTPYIKLLFTSKDGLTTKDFSTDSVAFGNRILSINHREEAYNGYALVVLKDHDSSVPNMVGYWTEIGYGDTTGAGNEYVGSQTSRLYVKHQRHITAQGNLYTVLELEDLWTRMEETLVRLGSAPLFQVSYDGTVSSVYVILKAIFVEAGLSLPTNCPVDDGIITTLLPKFDINAYPYERARGVAARLIQLTKCYIRPPSATGLQFGVVYPQAADAAVLTYNAITSPYFHSFMERAPALTPNHYVVYGNMGADGLWTSLLTSAAPNGVSQTDIDALYEIIAIVLAPLMTVQADIDNQAAVLLARARAEKDTGIAVIPHDCRVELYDKLAFVDNRRAPSTTYPSNALTRVSGLTHIYQPGKYQLEIYLGGLSTTATDRYTADTYIEGKRIEGRTGAEEQSEEQAGLKALMAANRAIWQKQLDEFRKSKELPDIQDKPVDLLGREAIERLEAEMEDPKNWER